MNKTFSFFKQTGLRLKRSFLGYFRLPVWKSRIIFWSFLPSFILLSVLLVYMAVKLPNHKILLTLHYTAQSGIDYIGDNQDFYRLPGLASVLFVLNLAFTMWIFKKNDLFAKVAALITLAVVVTTAAAVLIVFQIN